MRNTLIIFVECLILVGFPNGIYATTYDLNQKVVTSLNAKAQQSDLAHKIAESLTVEIGPRLAGSPEDLLAVNWATT